MGPLNNILNRIDACPDQNASPLKHAICSRATNFFVAFPTEVAAIAQNIILTPFVAAAAVVKTGAKVVALATGSEGAKNFAAKLPGFHDLLRTIARIVAYTIGAALTATLGVISPKTNFEVHCKMGLAIDRRKEAVLATLADVVYEEIRNNLENVEDVIVEAEHEDAATQQDAQQDLLEKEQEQEALENLATFFKMAEQIETHVEESADAAINAFKHVVVETADTVKTSVEATITAVEVKIEEAKVSHEEKTEEAKVSHEEKTEEAVVSHEEKADDVVISHEEKAEEAVVSHEEKTEDAVVSEEEKAEETKVAQQATVDETNDQEAVDEANVEEKIAYINDNAYINDKLSEFKLEKTEYVTDIDEESVSGEETVQMGEYEEFYDLPGTGLLNAGVDVLKTAVSNAYHVATNPVESAKSLTNNTYHVITNPRESTTKTYNYFKSFFSEAA